MTNTKIITNNAEYSLIESIEAQNINIAKSVLYCRFSAGGIVADPVVLTTKLKDVLEGRNGIFYCCYDTDIFIEWAGTSKETLENIRKIISAYCTEQNPEWHNTEFFQYFDLSAHSEELRTLCNAKIKALPADMKENIAQTTIIPPTDFTQEQHKVFFQSEQSRRFRKAPQILIVEDQVFSRTLLAGLLSKQYKCHIAKNGVEAISLYTRFAPDLVFLDVELPDINGHDLAMLFAKVDNKSHIIMVTANNYEKDVNLAKKNKVQGFIIKPYNKQKILTAIENYKKYKR